MFLWDHMGVFERSVREQTGRPRRASYLANVLVVAARVLLLQEELVPHPAPSHSSEQLLSSDGRLLSPSVSRLSPPPAQRQSVQGRAQTEDARDAQ